MSNLHIKRLMRKGGEIVAGVDFRDFVDEVIDRNDIAEVISEYAKIKRVGSRYSALCPLHNDKKSPSLSISPDKQLFHCFGCGAGGNVIHFIMAAENLDFMDALRFLADRAKLPFPQFTQQSAQKPENVDKKQLIYKINAEAARYFYSSLAGDKGEDALAYLQNRGIKNSTIKMFGIGYAPEGWTNLISYLKEKGYKEHEIYEAGLAKMRDNGTYYDAFYDGRVMFPIINVQGNVIGFGGRIMTDGGKTNKYINSPETIVFKKKENLFGLNLAKSDKSGQLLLMEGYMDVISLHQAGITNAVASLGTAFTEEQAKLVKRYGGKAVLCYDADDAGRKATQRAGEVLTANDIKTKVLTVTNGKDPDEFVRSKGGDLFRVLINEAKSLIEYRIDEVQKKYTMDKNGRLVASAEETIEFANEVAVVLSDIKNPIEYDVYINRIAESTGVSANSINAAVLEIRQKRAVTQDRQMRRQAIRNTISPEAKKTRDVGLHNAERLMLSLLCDKEVYKAAVERGLLPEDFSEGIHRALAEKIYGLYEDCGRADITKLLDGYDESERGDVSKILLDDKNVSDRKKACLQPLEIILGRKKRKKEEELLDSGDLESLNKLLKTRKQI